MSWYEDLREEYRPPHVRLLLVAESAPDPGDGNRRFFYAPTLAAADNLFRGVVQGLYGHRFPRGSAGANKVPWLERLRQDGVFLIDVLPWPANRLRASARRQALREHADAAVSNAKELAPQGIVVCHTGTFRVISGPLRTARLPLLHEEPLPFPLGNWRDEFADKLAALAQTVGIGSDRPSYG